MFIYLLYFSPNLDTLTQNRELFFIRHKLSSLNHFIGEHTGKLLCVQV